MYLYNLQVYPKCIGQKKIKAPEISGGTSVLFIHISPTIHDSSLSKLHYWPFIKSYIVHKYFRFALFHCGLVAAAPCSHCSISAILTSL